MLTKHRLSSVSVLTKRASNRALNARQNDGGLLMRKSHALRLHVAHPCVQKRGFLIGVNRTDDGLPDYVASTRPPPGALATDIPFISTSVYLWPKHCVRMGRLLEGGMFSKRFRDSFMSFIKREYGTKRWWREFDEGASMSVAALAAALEADNFGIMQPYTTPTFYEIARDKLILFKHKYAFSLKVSDIHVVRRWMHCSVEYPALEGEVPAVWQPMQGFGIKFSIPKTPELQKMLETREKAQMILQARITEVFDKAEADPKKAGELLKKVEASTYIQSEGQKPLATMTKEELMERLKPVARLPPSLRRTLSRDVAVKASLRDAWNFLKVMRNVRPGYELEKATVKMVIGVQMKAIHDLVVWRLEDEHQEIVHNGLKAPHIVLFEHQMPLAEMHNRDSMLPNYWLMSDFDGTVNWANAAVRQNIDAITKTLEVPDMPGGARLHLEKQLTIDKRSHLK